MGLIRALERYLKSHQPRGTFTGLRMASGTPTRRRSSSVPPIPLSYSRGFTAIMKPNAQRSMLEHHTTRWQLHS